MSSIVPQSVFAVNSSVNFQPVGDGAVILRVSDGQLYTCNQTTEAFLSHIDGIRTLSTIAAALYEEFEVDVDTVTIDLIEIARELIDENILRLVE